MVDLPRQVRPLLAVQEEKPELFLVRLSTRNGCRVLRGSSSSVAASSLIQLAGWVHMAKTGDA